MPPLIVFAYVQISLSARMDESDGLGVVGISQAVGTLPSLSCICSPLIEEMRSNGLDSFASSASAKS